MCNLFKLDEDDSYKTACSDASLRKAVKTSLDNAAAQARLTRIELIGNIRIVSDDWTPETGMLTSALKLKRQAIMTRYNGLIEVQNYLFFAYSLRKCMLKTRKTPHNAKF